MSKHIFWISSFPKSGNTLIRAILSSLFFTKNGEFDLNILKYIPNFESTGRLNFINDINKTDFQKINKLEILSKYWLKAQSKKNLGFDANFTFLKTHHALISFFNNLFTNEDNTLGFIYIIRDPRDVVISWAKHSNVSIDQSINDIIKDNFCIDWRISKNSLLSNKIKPPLFVSNWHNNVLSWINLKWQCPKLVIKYEDIVYDKKNIIVNIVNFFEKNYAFKFTNLDEKINNIIKTTDFKKLQKTEEKQGFGESGHGKFFRIGKKNQWKNELDSDQLEIIETNFKETMLAFDSELSK